MTAEKRDCENCKHHKEVCRGGIFYHSCEAWDCTFEPTEEGKEAIERIFQAIKEFQQKAAEEEQRILLKASERYVFIVPSEEEKKILEGILPKSADVRVDRFAPHPFMLEKSSLVVVPNIEIELKKSGAEYLEEVGGEIGSSCEKFIRQMTGNEGEGE